MIKAETKILKTIVCGMIFSTGILSMLIVFYIIGLYMNIFALDKYDFFIAMFFILIFIAPMLDNIMDVVLQRRKFYIIDGDAITIGSKSFLNTTQDTFDMNRNVSIKIRFENLFCYESIELYAFAEKNLIEKSELNKEDYMKIKDALLEKATNLSS